MYVQSQKGADISNKTMNTTVDRMQLTFLSFMSIYCMYELCSYLFASKETICSIIT